MAADGKAGAKLVTIGRKREGEAEASGDGGNEILKPKRYGINPSDAQTSKDAADSMLVYGSMSAGKTESQAGTRKRTTTKPAKKRQGNRTIHQTS